MEQFLLDTKYIVGVVRKQYTDSIHMRSSPKFQFLCFILLGMSFWIISGCSGITPELKLAQEFVEDEEWDQAVAAYREALRKDPFNAEIGAAFDKVKARAAEEHFLLGKNYLKKKQLPQALNEFQIALGLNPSKPEHHTALGDAVRLKDARTALQDAQKLHHLGRLDEALSTYERAIELDPELTKALEGITALSQAIQENKSIGGHTEPVTLRFQNTRLKQVFEILARTANINILFEKDVRDDLVTIFTKDLPFDEALTLILTTNQLFVRRVSPDTLLIIPDTKQKRQQFQDLQIRTFYLSNSKAKDTANLLRTILETKRVYVNEPLNTVVIRDQPEKLQLAEQIILANDRRDAEVVFDVEILEVNKSKTRKLGASFAKQAGFAVVPPDTTPIGAALGAARLFTYKDLTSLNKDSFLFTFPSGVLLDFFKAESDAKILASPKLRVLNNQKASINIGDKQPILLSTTNVQPGQASTGAVPTTSTVTSIEFKDTGIKLDIEPTIHLTDEITIKLKIEVITLGDLVRLQSDPVIEQFRFGTRIAETTLNLKDGETVILAGLMSETDRKQRESVPGIDDVPIIEDLFFNQTEKQVTEVILAITPRLVRNVNPPTIVKQTLWSGTAAQYATTPLFSPPDHLPVSFLEDQLDASSQIPEEDSPESIHPTNASSSTTTQPESLQASKPTPSPPMAKPGKIVISPSQLTTRVGQTIRVTLMAEDLPKIDKIGFTLTYDSKIMDFKEAVPGDLLGKDEEISGLNISASPKTGQLTLQLGNPQKPFEGKGQLVTLIFTAKATGKSPLVIRRPNLFSGSGSPLPVTAQHGLVRVM
jgi:general secretion pathway protein D